METHNMSAFFSEKDKYLSVTDTDVFDAKVTSSFWGAPFCAIK